MKQEIKITWSICTVIAIAIVVVAFWPRYWVQRGKGPAMTQMMLAAAAGDSERVIYFIEKGREIDERTDLGDTALSYAVGNDNADIVKLLILNGANPQIGRDYEIRMIVVVAQSGDVELLTSLLGYIDKDRFECHGAIGILTGICDTQALKVLLESMGADSSWGADKLREYSVTDADSDCASEIWSLVAQFEN